jgi:hypothetical protein
MKFLIKIQEILIQFLNKNLKNYLPLTINLCVTRKSTQILLIFKVYCYYSLKVITLNYMKILFKTFNSVKISIKNMI